MNKSNCLVCIYNDPDYYPPTFNGIYLLSQKFRKVIVICRSNQTTNLKFASNVEVLVFNKADIEGNLFLKVVTFFKYSFRVKKVVNKYNPELLLVYDQISLLAYCLFRNGNSSVKIWYHSHDVIEINKVRKFSIGWFAAHYEKQNFRYVNVFTLPTFERIKYYSLEKFKGHSYEIPNYPALSVFSKHTVLGQEKNIIKLLYQGNVSRGHGFEKIILILGGKANGKSIYLNLLGHCEEEYENYLKSIALKNNVSDYLNFFGRVIYSELPKISSGHHIGLAIYTESDIMNSTLGKASNKIYEYAALGMPVLYFESEYYKGHLSKYLWARETNLERNNLICKISEFDANYDYFSKIAKEDFVMNLNYETVFEKVLDKVVYE